jgi:hypothetical protein
MEENGRIRPLLALVGDIGSVVALCLWLFPVLLSVITLVAILLLPRPQVYIVTAFVGGLVVMPARGVLSAYRSSRFRGYRGEEASNTFAFDPNNPRLQVHTSEFEIKITRTGAPIFEDSYCWSGRGTEMLPVVLSPGHALLGGVLRDGIRERYNVYLGDHVKGDSDHIKVQQIVEDSEGTLLPYYSMSVIRPWRRLNLRVIFPPDECPRSVKLGVYNGSDPTTTLISQRTRPVDSTSEVVWSIRPKRGRSYRISWPPEEGPKYLRPAGSPAPHEPRPTSRWRGDEGRGRTLGRLGRWWHY